MFRTIILVITALLISNVSIAQHPCTGNPVYRQFDFWVGEWEAFGKNGKKAGDSKISIILDSCVVLEEWTATNLSRGVIYRGKSLNTYNAKTGLWMQTWMDNVGGVLEYNQGKYEENKMTFLTLPVEQTKDTMVIMRMTFFNIDHKTVRQLGEVSKDNGATWTNQFDLEYRRKNK